MALDYGGMRPTFIYDPQNDPEIRKWDKALEALHLFTGYMAAEAGVESKREDTIIASELAQLQNLNIDVDIGKYFEDAEYRTTMKGEKSARMNIANKAFNWTPDADKPGVLSPILLAFKSVYGAEVDITPGVFTGNDLKLASQIILEGDKDLNEPAIIQLTSEELDGIPGMKDELLNLGLLQEGEDWEEARLKIPQRWDWFSTSVRSGTDAMGKGKNTNFLSNQTEIDQRVSQTIALHNQRIDAIGKRPEVEAYKLANSLWQSEKDDIIGKTVDDGKIIINNIELEDWVKTNKETWRLFGLSIPALSEMKEINPDIFESMMAGASSESTLRGDSFTMQLKTRLREYDTGLQMYRSVNKGVNVFESMELEERARKSAVDLEEINDVLIPLAQQTAYLSLIKDGSLAPASGMIEEKYLNPDGSINFDAVDEDMAIGSKNIVDYMGIMKESYMSGAINIPLAYIQNQFNQSLTKHRALIFESPDEKIARENDEQRDEYLDAIMALEYENIWRKTQ